MFVKVLFGRCNDGQKIYNVDSPSFELDDKEAQKLIDIGQLQEVKSMTGLDDTEKVFITTVEIGVTKLRSIAEDLGIANVKKATAEAITAAIEEKLTLIDVVGSQISDVNLLLNEKHLELDGLMKNLNGLNDQIAEIQAKLQEATEIKEKLAGEADGSSNEIKGSDTR
jgi:hypothetical protein